MNCGKLKLDVGRVDVDLGEIRCLAKTFENCDFLDIPSYTTESACQHRGFLFLQSPSKHQRRAPIPGIITTLLR